jgi:hypothetical protein
VSAWVSQAIEDLTNGNYDNLVNHNFNEQQLNEFLPALGAALGRAVVGAGAGALERGAASMAGRVVGSEIDDAISSDNEVDETIDPKNPRDYEIPAYLRQQQGMKPLTMKDIEDKEQKAQTDYQRRVGNIAEADDAGLIRLRQLAGFMAK